MSDLPDIIGSKKSNGGGGGTESPNTIRSDMRARLIELISEGPCVGFAVPDNEGSCIYFDQTPLINSNGTVNFKGVQWEFRTGLPDQPDFVGNPQAETVEQVEVQVKKNVGSVIRVIEEANATQVRVVVRVPALVFQDTSNGNILPSSVGWTVDVAPNGGNWQTMDVKSLINQKCTSPVEFASLITLPTGGCPWQIRVTRTTPDSNISNVQNDTWWESYSIIVGGRFTYPNSALCYLNVDAALFDASNIPARSFHWKGLIISVPSNYDPVARTYTGVWDGTFQQAWTNNPAWIFYDLVVNDRYGLGEFVDVTKIDKWGLYQIAQYCDAPVPNGIGGTEPRYTFNAQIVSKQEAAKCLQMIATAWRGMAYWSLGQVFASADMPQDAVKLVAPADVLTGHFNYMGTAMKARHSVALVHWQDPTDFYRSAIEVVIDDEMLQQWGWRQLDIQAVGCTSRGLARRYGLWALDTEKHATESIEYEASWDHADPNVIRPGAIVSVADPYKAQVRNGGRIAALDGGGVYTLDKAFVPESGQTYNLLVELPNGTIGSAQIMAFNGAQVQVSPDFAMAPNLAAMWAITGTNVAPREFRLISVNEESTNKFKITGLIHDPTKYARVEQNVTLDPIPYYRPKTTIAAPTNIQVNETLYFVNGVAKARLTVSWTPGQDFASKTFELSADTPQGFVDFGSTTATSMDLEDTQAGTYTFYVTAVGVSGLKSQPIAAVPFIAAGWAKVDPPYVSQLEIFGQGQNTSFSGLDCRFDWQNNFPGSTVAIGTQQPVAEASAGTGDLNPLYRDNVVRIYDAVNGTLLRVEVVTNPYYTYTYDHNTQDNANFGRGPQRTFKITVTVRDNIGRESNPAELIVDNPVPDIVTPILQTGVGSLFVSYVPPKDPDYAGAFIWADENPNFDPMATAPAYSGPNNSISIQADQFKTYYVRIACYDVFSKSGLNVSPPASITIGGVEIDTTPPAVPTNLVLTAGVETLPTGEVRPTLTANVDPSPSSNFSYFDFQILVSGGNYLSYPSAVPSHEWDNLIANGSYTVQVRAVSQLGHASGFCVAQSITLGKKTTGPGSVTNFAITASLKSAFLSWTNPTDPDLDHIEIWVGTTNVLANASMIGTSYTSVFTHSGLTTGTVYYYWLRPVNTSGVPGSYTGPTSVTPGQVANGDIAAGAITAASIQAGSITGDRLNISTSLPSTITIGNTGVQIGAAANPAALINSGTTQVSAGMILLSGTSALSTWQSGADATKIAGGSLEANTVDANKLTIGIRGVTVSGLVFSFDKVANVLSWTAGTIQWFNDSGVSQSIGIAAGSQTWTTGVLFVSWQEGASALTIGTAPPATATGIVLASYAGDVDLVPYYGRTIIDGSTITTASITSTQLSTSELITTSAQIGNALITNAHLAGSITFDKMTGGALTATEDIEIGGTNFVLNAANQTMTIKDVTSGNITRLVLGKIGPNEGDFGIEVYDATGKLVLSSGAGVSAGSITGTFPASQVSGLGSLATANSVDSSQVSGLGIWATAGQVTSSNISTYIANAAIQDAQIGSISASKISVTELSAISANLGTVTAGMIKSVSSNLQIDLNNNRIVIYGN